MAIIRQTNFGAGELSPLLWGRTDLELRNKGLKTLKNFFVTKQGALMNRAGTTWCGVPSYGGVTRLIPFIGSTSYVLEFAPQDGPLPGKILVWANGRRIAPTINAYSALTSYNIGNHVTYGGSTYRSLTAANLGNQPDISPLQWTVERQSFDVQATGAYNPASTYREGNYVTYGGNTYRSRAAANLGNQPDISPAWWEIETVFYVTTTYLAADIPKIRYAQVGDQITLTCPTYAPRELVRAGALDWQLSTVSFARPAAAVGVPDLLAPVPAGGAGDPARAWRWRLTQVTRLPGTHFLQESAPYDITVDSAGVALPALIACSVTSPVTVRANSTYAAIATDPDFIGYRIYRGRGGMYGWVGDIKNTMAASNWVDAGETPIYEMPPPLGRNPFEVYNSAGVLQRTESPAAVAYFQERRLFAATTERPNTFFLSATQNYYDLDERLIPTTDSSLLFALSSRRRESILYAMGLQDRILLFTDQGVWTVQGKPGEALSAVSVMARLEVEIGSKLLPPVQVGNAILFSPALGMAVYATQFENERQGFGVVDVSAQSAHLLRPDGLTLASGSIYAGANGSTNPGEIVAWAYAAVPYGILWMVRNDGRLLSLTFSDLDGSWGWAVHETAGTVVDCCVIRENNEDLLYLVVYRPGLDTAFEYSIERMHYRSRRDWAQNDVFTDCSIGIYQSPSTTITGLNVLEGQSVYVTSKDNPVFGPLTVSGGSITLPELPAVNDGGGTAWRGYVGLAYTCDIETLGLPQAPGKQKLVRSVSFEVFDSQGMWVGEDLTDLIEWRQRSVAHGYGTITAATEVVTVYPKSTWNEYGRAALRQVDPRSVTVVGISREVEVGD